MLSIAALAGEAAWGLASEVVRLGDGSWIAVQLDAPAYHAGQVLSGKVIAAINSPVVCDDVSVVVQLEEATYWDAETSRTVWEDAPAGHAGHAAHNSHAPGQAPPPRVSRVVWEHAARQYRGTLFREVVRVAALTSVLPPGMWQWPFSYAIPPGAPGVVKFRRSEEAGDPAWRAMGRRKETRAEVSFSIAAVLQCRGVFSSQLRSSQEIVVNPFFDWSKMAPARASTAGAVVVCCCFNKGPVLLNSTCDKSAYQAGEVVQVSANIQNDSTYAFRRMTSKLIRTIVISDGAGGAHRIVDRICAASYEGVPAKSAVVREMPLTLESPSGFLPSIQAPHVQVQYTFVCECDVPYAPDISCSMPMTIYQPAPAVSSFAAAFGGAVPANAQAFV